MTKSFEKKKITKKSAFTMIPRETVNNAHFKWQYRSSLHLCSHSRFRTFQINEINLLNQFSCKQFDYKLDSHIRERKRGYE